MEEDEFVKINKEILMNIIIESFKKGGLWYSQLDRTKSLIEVQEGIVTKIKQVTEGAFNALKTWNEEMAKEEYVSPPKDQSTHGRAAPQ